MLFNSISPIYRCYNDRFNNVTHLKVTSVTFQTLTFKELMSKQMRNRTEWCNVLRDIFTHNEFFTTTRRQEILQHIESMLMVHLSINKLNMYVNPGSQKHGNVNRNFKTVIGRRKYF